MSLGSGCGPGPSRAEIQDADAGQRILAIRAAGERRDPAAVPLLVDRLDDEDEGVRFYAILALERITGTRLGYDYRARGAEQVRAIERWREAVESGRFAAAAAITEEQQPRAAMSAEAAAKSQ